MWISGLVSVSFRKETPETIIQAVKDTGLSAIEWGGDVHVPPTDLENAARIGRLTKEAGLSVAAYGSYFRLGTGGDFAPVLAAAKALGAPVIRIWAGTADSADTPPETRAALVAEAQLVAAMAEKAGITVTLECHGGTLTDNWASALDFVRSVDHPCLKMYWQPNQFRDIDYNRQAARQLAGDTVNLHVFHWDNKGCYPLAEGEAHWHDYLAIFRERWAGDGRDHALLLEFMHDGRLESLAETAATLNRWISEWE